MWRLKVGVSLQETSVSQRNVLWSDRNMTACVAASGQPLARWCSLHKETETKEEVKDGKEISLLFFIFLLNMQEEMVRTIFFNNLIKNVSLSSYTWLFWLQQKLGKCGRKTPDPDIGLAYTTELFKKSKTCLTFSSKIKVISQACRKKVQTTTFRTSLLPAAGQSGAHQLMCLLRAWIRSPIFYNVASGVIN